MRTNLRKQLAGARRIVWRNLHFVDAAIPLTTSSFLECRVFALVIRTVSERTPMVKIRTVLLLLHVWILLSLCWGE